MIETKKVIIVGGGIAGLSLAHELQRDGVDYLLFESSRTVGGLCSSWKDREDFWHDFGPHIFHGRDGFDWFKDLVPDWIQGERKDVVVLADGEVTSYPVQCVCNSAKEEVSWDNYSEFCYHNYGKDIFWRFFLPYNEKFYGHPLSEVSSSIAGRAPRVTDRLQPFLYPKSGRFAELPERIYQRLSKQRVKLGSPVEFVDLHKKLVVSGGVSYGYDRLVWAAPIDLLLTMLGRRSEAPDSYIDTMLVTKVYSPPLEFLSRYSALTNDEEYRMSSERVIKGNDSPFVQMEINLRKSAGPWLGRENSFVIPRCYIVPTLSWMSRRERIEKELRRKDIFLHGRAGRGVHMHIWPIICASKELLPSLT
jgi:protoporphyrinogen oxidase